MSTTTLLLIYMYVMCLYWHLFLLTSTCCIKYCLFIAFCTVIIINIVNCNLSFSVVQEKLLIVLLHGKSFRNKKKFYLIQEDRRWNSTKAWHCSLTNESFFNIPWSKFTTSELKFWYVLQNLFFLCIRRILLFTKSCFLLFSAFHC